MCIAVPGKVLSVKDGKAEVDFFGKKETLNCKFVKVRKNDYVLTFGEYILEKISKTEAKEIFETLREGYVNQR